MINKFLCFLFSKIYKKWLFDSFSGKYWKPIKVKGWRTALVDLNGRRQTTTPCFWIFD